MLSVVVATHDTRSCTAAHSYAVLSLLYSRTHESTTCFCHPRGLAVVVCVQRRLLRWRAPTQPSHCWHCHCPSVTTGAGDNKPFDRDYLQRLRVCPVSATRDDTDACAALSG